MVSWLTPLCDNVTATMAVGATVVVAVSGGGDSVALLHGLARTKATHGLRLIVAHLDHGLRPESADEAAFVGQLALDLGLPCLRERRDLSATLAEEGGNLEALARAERYAFLEEVAAAVGASAIATAHTQDDQAETLLLNLLRGAGLDGLSGMACYGPSAHGATPLLRPLLGVGRATLRAWLRDEGLTWHDDQSNSDPNRQRGYLRHELIPKLEARFPALRQRLAQSAALLHDEKQWIEGELDAEWRRMARLNDDGISLDRALFLAAPRAVQRRLLRRAFYAVAAEGTALSFQHVEVALTLAAEGHSGQRATLPGFLFLQIVGNQLWVGGALPTPDGTRLAQPLRFTQPGNMASDGLRVSLAAVGREALPPDWADLPSRIALLDAERAALPLTLRHSQPGERWQPLGFDGASVAIDEWLAKHGVPARDRPHVLLLVDGNETVLWLVGQQVGHVAHVRAESERLWRLIVESSDRIHTLIEGQSESGAA
ncbi:MAG: tRNA lysidine(34) synthetase TilS [Anaerolineales bacterium]|nr:tRNA lysidine(34) synthetase TilS [Anaerolineales bacterium]MCB9129083.1 tRNA lysidine(34) synthetase TilS [Ardenticatenales bacterium]MCB9172765.1 tRNA lysidine(34) synthetase TilS [Ardenticatenales bacterium]